MRRAIWAAVAACVVAGAGGQVTFTKSLASHPQVRFAEKEVLKAAGGVKGRLEIAEVVGKGGPESFRIIPHGSSVTVEGGDVRGLMYGLLAVAEQIELTKSLAIKPRNEKPFLKYRVVKFNTPFKGNVYLSDEDAANSAWFFDLDYWDAFFTMMAKARYNTVSFWHSHPFGNVVRLKKYPEAAVLSGEEMGKEIAFWHKLYKLAHDHGMQVMWMTWNIHTTPQFAKAHGIRDAGQDSPLVRDYMKECIKEMLREYPEIDMFGTCPGEAMGSLGPDGQEKWIKECILDPINEVRPGMPFVHRYWGATPAALAKMLVGAKYPGPMLLDIKFNGEHMYSSTKPHVLNKKWLTQKAPYEIFWHLRNDDLFQFNWGDPEFASKLMKSCAGSAGYVVGSETDVPGVDRYHQQTEKWHMDWKWNWQKHWFRWMLWGRMGYDPTMGEDVWRGYYQAKYGKDLGGKVYRAVKIGSRIIPYLESFHWDYMNGDWYAEGNCGGWNTSFEMPRENFRRRQMWHDVDAYIYNNTIDDWALSIPEMAARVALGEPLPKDRKTPADVAAQLMRWSDECLRAVQSPIPIVAPLGSGIGAPPRGLVLAECDLKDAECVSLLGHYYALKIQAAAALARYQFNGDALAKEVALEGAHDAARTWADLAKVADAHYVKHEVWLMGQFSWGMYLPDAKHDIDEVAAAKPIPRTERVWHVAGKDVCTVTWSHVGDPAKDGWIDYMNGIAGRVKTKAATAWTTIDLPGSRPVQVKLIGDGMSEATTPDQQAIRANGPAVTVTRPGRLDILLDPSKSKEGFMITVTPQPKTDDQVVIPANSGKPTAPFRIADDKTSPYGKVLDVPKGVGHGLEGSDGPLRENGWADYTFQAKLATTYEIWGRVWFKDDDSNSFFVKVDDGEYLALRDETFGKWHWVKVEGSAVLSAGSHTLQIRNREDGCRIDEVRLIPQGLDPMNALPLTFDEKLNVLGPAAADAQMVAYHAKMSPIRHPKGTESKAAWEKRKAEVRKLVAHDIGLDPMPNGVPLDPHIVSSEHRDGYTLSRIYWQLFPGCYGSGWLYVPDNIKGRVPAVLNPHGHFEHGAYNPTVQARLIAMAKKGVINLVTDSIHAADFETGMCPIGLMTLQNIRGLDYLCSRPDVDTKRIGITGASGGGQQTMYMMALDDRLAVAVPAVMACYYNRILWPTWSHCWCNHAPGIAGDTDPIEYLSLFAPKPAFFISDTQDWTADFPKAEWFDVKKVWDLYGAGDQIGQNLDTDPHDYHKPRRELMYKFMYPHLGVDDPDHGNEPPLTPETEQFLAKMERPLDGLRDWGKAAEWYRAHCRAPATRADLQPRLKALLRSVSPVAAQVGADSHGELDGGIERLLIHGESGLKLPALLIKSPSATAKAPVAIVLLPGGKKAAFSDGRPIPVVKALLNSGSDVLALDARLTGELDRNWPWDTTIWGRPEAGMGADDAIWAAAYLATRSDVDASRISLLGVGKMGSVALFAACLHKFAGCVFDSQAQDYTTAPLHDQKGYFNSARDIRSFPLPLVPQILQVGDLPDIAAGCQTRLAVMNPGSLGYGSLQTLAPDDRAGVAAFVAGRAD